MREYIQELIDRKKKIYQDNYHEMLGDYNREIETIKGYNGRQLLELLQNCDDEEATEVSIELDKKYRKLSISNNGKPFSKKGYRSLFIANLSAKTSKRKYIGNKGLGFRSIINWSNTIEIASNGILLNYSRYNSHQKFRSLFSPEVRDKIRNEENFKRTISPIPFLALPDIKDFFLEQFVTRITIHYQESFFEDIVDQIKNITPTTLLFLRNIEKITFKGIKGVEGLENLDDIVCYRERLLDSSIGFSPEGKIVFNKNEWFIFEEERELPQEFADSDKEEKEFYQIKVAVEKEFKQSSPYLYSFFPTNIILQQPYVLHATFDLDSNRNQINNSRKNKFLLERTVQFTIAVAKFYTGENVSYRPLEILKHEFRADTLSELGYYDLIEAAINSEEVFPCIDNTYKCLDDVLYASEDFAELLKSLKADKILSNHLIPTANEQLSEYLSDIVDNDLEMVGDTMNVFNNIAALPMSINQRANFIKQILHECSFIKYKYENEINFLVNSDNQIIKGKEFTYTPITRNTDLKTPSFTAIQFINKNLFNELINVLEFEESESNHKSRFLYDQIKGYSNIHSYEPATLAQKIISETNKQIQTIPDLALEYVREMHQCLYYNFKKIDEETQETTLRTSTPVITSSGKIKGSIDVVMSGDYPIGEKTEIIFEGIYDDDIFIASPKTLGFDEIEEISSIEAYLLWIQVNRFTRYRSETVRNIGIYDYVNFVQKRKNLGSRTGYEIDYKYIENFSKILKKISPYKLLLWAHFDQEFKEQLYDDQNSDSYIYLYYGQNRVHEKPSYIKYQIIESFKFSFEDYLLEEKFTWVNDFQIDYSHTLFSRFGITKSTINEILVSLGAKDKFEDLSISKVSQILNTLPEKYPSGQKSLTFYKRALNHFRENGEELDAPVTLFADNGTGLKPFEQDQIYFSDRIKLPTHLKGDFPIFNFPSRAGGAEAINFFGINDLKEVNILLKKYNIFSELSSEFCEKFDQIKPLILTQRISVIDDAKPQKVQASICNRIKIQLCSTIEYEVEDKTYSAGDYEFVPAEDYSYYLKIGPNYSIEGLLKNSTFTDSVADILTLSFDVVGEKNAFRYLIRSRFEDALHSVISDFGEDTLQEARALLGLVDHKQAFWQAIFVSKGIRYEEHLDDLALENLIYEKFDLSFDVTSLHYDSLNSRTEEMKIKALFESLGLTLAEFGSNYHYEFNISRSHYQTIKNLILSRKNRVKGILWQRFQSAGIEVKSLYLEEINKYEGFHDFAMQKGEELKYDFDVDEESVWKEYVFSIYKEIDLNSNLDLQAIKKRNLKLFSDPEQEKILQDEKFRSLIYFEDAVQTIKKEIDNSDTEQELETEYEPVPSNFPSDTNEPRVLDSEMLRTRKKAGIPSTRKGVYVPSEKKYKKLKEKGNRSEDRVYEHLRKSFDNVDKVSEDNEGLHCDIRYTDEKGIVKYVEVKSFDNGRFFLSRSEFDFGKDNKQDYEIWLVKDNNDLIPITDFFDNPKYQPVINEYVVYLDLENHSKLATYPDH